MTYLFIGLLSLAAASIGLRVTSVIVGPAWHPLLRLFVALAAGAVFVLVTLDVSRNLRVFELGLGLLASLAPVGVFDLLKWWFRWRMRRPPG